MRQLTPEQAAAIYARPIGKGSYVRRILMSMKPGEYVLIEPRDWKWKSKKPSYMCRKVERANPGLKFECSTAMERNNSNPLGWLIKREK